MSTSISDYRDLYLSQARLQLERITDALHRLERGEDPGALQVAERAAHTLKGMSATMGYETIVSATHALEDLLQASRHHSSDLSLYLSESVYPALDEITEYLDQVSVEPAPPNSSVPTNLSYPFASAAPYRVNLSIEHLDTIHYLAAALLATSRGLQARDTAPNDATRQLWSTQLALVRQLQELGWHLRMFSFGDVVARAAFLLTDLAHSQNKEIQIQVTGETVEIGAAIAQELGAALGHLLRNAVTHGIEPAQERRAAGKAERGVIRIRAGLDGDLLIVQVADDGRGLDAAQIRQAALEQGYISAKQSAEMSDADAYKLLTIQGLSLSPRVTTMAGRGIGLDDVKTFVDAVGGSLSIQTQPGQGTGFTLRLPRTLGVIPVELVAIGPFIYALPISQVDSTMTIAAAHLARLEEDIAQGPKMGSRLYHLRALLALPEGQPQAEYGIVTLKQSDLVMVVVDELLGRTLWFNPPEVHAPPATLLDLAALLPR